MFAALQFPFGGLPANGTNSVSYPPPIWQSDAIKNKYRDEQYKNSLSGNNWFLTLKDSNDSLVEEVADALFGSAAKDKPSFTSIAFPYSGYYALRGGWTNEALYMWFTAPRKGPGHSLENINSLAVAAYGRHMLVDSGPDPYGNKSFLPEDQWAYMKAITDYSYSSFSHNTLIVDGQSQRRLIYGELFSEIKPYEKPINARWHRSPNFDFAEGYYNDGYGNEKHINISVTHNRQIVFVKCANLWIVRDIAKSNEPHKYTQVWNFPPPYMRETKEKFGFSNSQVEIDKSAKLVHTTDPNGPNISLYHFTSMPLEYDKYFGQIKPWLGWFSFNIGGRRMESADVHVSWEDKADSSLVTLIIPHREKEAPIKSLEDLS
jgi:hypothetical protein